MSIAGNADCAVLQKDGKILVAGSFTDSRPFAIVARINSNGSIDSSFGGKGYSTLAIGNYRGAVIGHGLGMLNDSRIILGGYGADSSDKSAQFLIRLMPDGSPDTSLGHTGQRFPFNASYTREVIIQPDGKTLICVQGFNGMQAVIRFGLDGNIDESYGEQGFAYIPDTFVVATGILL
jgi:uncharacterized delta-60 repeat protein